jgi:hypothetical protein
MTTGSMRDRHWNVKTRDPKCRGSFATVLFVVGEPFTVPSDTDDDVEGALRIVEERPGALSLLTR